MGEGIFQGPPLFLAGVKRISETMDWGGVAELVSFGEVRSSEVDECAFYVLLCPQNQIGGSIMADLADMVIIQLVGGVRILMAAMQVNRVEEGGRDDPWQSTSQRCAFVWRSDGCPGEEGENGIRRVVHACIYHFCLLYTSGTFFPITGVLRYSYGGTCDVSWSLTETFGL